jgi:hypothetical protein
MPASNRWPGPARRRTPVPPHSAHRRAIAARPGQNPSAAPWHRAQRTQPLITLAEDSGTPRCLSRGEKWVVCALVIAGSSP